VKPQYIIVIRSPEENSGYWKMIDVWVYEKLEHQGMKD
jgi:hypothetical protein